VARRTLYTLSVDNYAPQITAFTFPLMKRWAEKCRMDFYVIDQRKFPDYPPVFEKMQIYDLATERDDEFSVYLDADALVHPQMWNIADHLPRNTVCHNGSDMAGERWVYDEYFLRDGRHIGSGNWLAAAWDWCRDLWHPPDISFAEAVTRIYPTVNELLTVIEPQHLIDDYTLSRNIARFGLKFTTVINIAKSLGYSNGAYFWHQYTISVPEKVREIVKVLGDWRLIDQKDVKKALELAGALEEKEGAGLRGDIACGG